MRRRVRLVGLAVAVGLGWALAAADVVPQPVHPVVPSATAWTRWRPSSPATANGSRS